MPFKTVRTVILARRKAQTRLHRECSTANTVISDIQPQKFKMIHFCCLKFPVCGTLLWHPYQSNRTSFTEPIRCGVGIRTLTCLTSVYLLNSSYSLLFLQTTAQQHWKGPEMKAGPTHLLPDNALPVASIQVAHPTSSPKSPQTGIFLLSRLTIPISNNRQYQKAMQLPRAWLKS